MLGMSSAALCTHLTHQTVPVCFVFSNTLPTLPLSLCLHLSHQSHYYSHCNLACLPLCFTYLLTPGHCILSPVCLPLYFTYVLTPVHYILSSMYLLGVSSIKSLPGALSLFSPTLTCSQRVPLDSPWEYSVGHDI